MKRWASTPNNKQADISEDDKASFNTPLDRVMDVIEGLLNGKKPYKSELEDLHEILKNSNDVLRPEFSRKRSNYGDEVSRAILEMVSDAVPRMPRASMDVRRMSVEESEPISPSGRQLLHMAETSWHVDAFEMVNKLGPCALTTVCMHFMKEKNLFRRTGLREKNMLCFLSAINSSQGTHAYHNKAHTISVVHHLHILLEQLSHSMLIDELTLVACYIAAASHDVLHLGVNNDFLIQTRHQLAVMYNDISPMEMMHAATCVRLMQNHDVLLGMAPELEREVRSLIIELILATDMKHHFEHISNFNRNMRDCGGVWRTHASQELSFSSEESVRAVLKMAIKCSDLAHLTLPKDQHVRWVSALLEEFHAQGDREKALRLRVTPLMDRNATGMFKTQMAFLDMVAMPMFDTFADNFNFAEKIRDGVKLNLAHWKMVDSLKF